MGVSQRARLSQFMKQLSQSFGIVLCILFLVIYPFIFLTVVCFSFRVLVLSFRVLILSFRIFISPFDVLFSLSLLLPSFGGERDIAATRASSSAIACATANREPSPGEY